jgi:dTDP-4-amino-4,6-dideoxygalactose transaminase
MTHIPFNKPHAVGTEFDYIREAIDRRHLSMDGPFTRRCQAWLEDRTGAQRAVLTHSATGGLELIALLLDVGPGDEIVMPSFTFVSTANAFVLRGATPVFVDVRVDTLNLDETLVEDAITERTKAIMAVHYGGVSCEMEALAEIAARHGVELAADAAQALGTTYHGNPVPRLGALSALSFHETKNVISGEGGALLVNDARFSDRAYVLRDKGTNRQEFFRGEVDRYTWIDLGSSFGPSEIVGAFLWAQLERADEIDADRLRTWTIYHDAFAALEAEGLVRRPVIPEHCTHNAHMYYLLARDAEERSFLLRALNERDVNAVFHYVPLHSSPAGMRYGRAVGDLAVTTDVSERLIRLPLWAGMPRHDAERVAETVISVVRQGRATASA